MPKNRANRRNKGRKSLLSPKIFRPAGLVQVPKQFNGVAGATRVTLKYMESFTTTAASGYLTLRANDLFDPQAATSGITGSSNQQPSYFDTWKLMYNKYRVLAGTINVRIINGAANGVATFWEVSGEDQLTTTSNAAQASLSRFVTARIMPNGSSCPPLTLSKSLSTAKVNGVSEAQVLVEDNYQSLTTATPGDPWYWQLRFSATDFSTVPSCAAFVHVTFDVIFSDPVNDLTNNLDRKYSSKDECKDDELVMINVAKMKSALAGALATKK